MMLRYKKAPLIMILLTTSLACSLPARIITALGTQASNPQSAQPQSQSVAPTAMVFNVGVHTEVISPTNILGLTKSFASTEQDGMDNIFVVLENNSTDPLYVITDVTATITRFDENNQVIDKRNLFEEFTSIFPQEKRLVMNHQKEVSGRKTSLVRIEVTKVATVKSFDTGPGSVPDRISAQKWSHPFVTTTPGTFEMKSWLMDLAMGISKVTVQNNIKSKIKPTAVGLYYDEKNELIGVGNSGPFDLPALGSANVEVITVNLTSVPVRMDYFVEMPEVSVPEMLDLLFP